MKRTFTEAIGEKDK